jgi:hypothetical protein
MMETLKKAAELLTEYSAEFKQDGDEAWVSVPTLHNIAVELEYDTEDEDYLVHIRAWSPDHGLCSEELIHVTRDLDDAVHVVKERAAQFLKYDMDWFLS